MENPKRSQKGVWNIKSEDFYRLRNSYDRIKFLLKYAILAPSTHNSQPWLFKINKTSCTLLVNNKIQLKETDVLSRDLYISLGCCLENLKVAAEYFRVFDRITYILKNNTIAEIHFKNLTSHKKKINKKTQPIFDAILKRSTVRGFFSQKPIPNSIMNKIKKMKLPKDFQMSVENNLEIIKTFSRLTAQGLRLAYNKSAFRKEMSQWIVSNFSKRKDGIPGYALRMPNMMSIVFPKLVRHFDIGKRVSVINYKSMSSSRLVCIISAQKNSKITWLRTGQLAEQAMLFLNSHNVKTSIFVAAIEIDNLPKQLRKIIKTKFIPQFLFCAGYMDHIPPHSQRHSVEEKIISYEAVR